MLNTLCLSPEFSFSEWKEDREMKHRIYLCSSDWLCRSDFDYIIYTLLLNGPYVHVMSVRFSCFLCVEGDVPALEEFLGICKKHLQNSEPSLRPKLASLLDHVCFKHKFIKIHSFLVELPLKTEVEKNNFFRFVCCK